ncbi:MAG: hypothetical protein M3Q29_01805 [Chloroflexota bacterium]|nr:hypothetical protein [Chloroflexota bacterium]
MKRTRLSRRLAEGDLIVDITGGTKPMTAGAVLACREQGVAVQYMYAQRDPVTGELLRDRDDKVGLVALRLPLAATVLPLY